MNKDLLARIPGGDRMAGGAVLFALGLWMFLTFKYSNPYLVRAPMAALAAYGFYTLARGLVEWKYSNTSLHEILNRPEYLFIDIPIHNGDLNGLHRVEDALIEFARNRWAITVEGHSVDRPNSVGTICLKGRQADAMFASVHIVLAAFAPGQSLSVFPNPGHPADPEINGKRVIMHVTNRG